MVDNDSGVPGQRTGAPSTQRSKNKKCKCPLFMDSMLSFDFFVNNNILHFGCKENNYFFCVNIRQYTIKQNFVCLLMILSSNEISKRDQSPVGSACN